MSAILTLRDFGLHGTRRPPYTGIWIENRKIAAIGVAVRRGITFHGLALNVNADLSYFQRIVPCGLTWAEVTSMTRELSGQQSAKRVQERFLYHFANIFGYSDIKESDVVGDTLTSGIQNDFGSPIQLETRDSELEIAP
jgi:lipoate-protein ligase B